MSLSKYHKNCILTGQLDGYCLICEDHMKCEEDYSAHIEKPVHKKKLDGTPYYEKFQNECIRKVKKGYYCEVCNVLLTAAKVRLHIAEFQHNYNRNVSQLKRVDKNQLVFAFNNILIGDKSWNGFVDDTCFICNTDFEDVFIHKTSQDHILNLIQKKLEFGENDAVYRKVDESLFQCLTCNLVMPTDDYSDHFISDDHNVRLRSARTGGEVTLEDLEKNKSTTKMETKPIATENKPAIIQKQPNTQNETAEKSKREPTKDNHVVKENHKQHEDNKKKTKDDEIKAITKCGKIAKDRFKNALELDEYICKVLRAKDYIALNHESNPICLLCDWVLEPSAVLRHVTGRHHLTMLKLHKERLQKLSNNQENQVQEETIVKEDNETPMDSKTEDDKGKLLDSLQEFQKNDININFEMNVANCKKCSKSFRLEFDVLKNHIEEHKKKGNKEKKTVPLQSGTNIKQSGTNGVKSNETGNTSLYTKPVLLKNKEGPQATNAAVRDDEKIGIFANENNMSYSNGKVFCKVCDSKLSPSLKFLKQHVEGFQHKNKTKLLNLAVTPFKAQKPGVKPKLPEEMRKIALNVFCTSTIGISNVFGHRIIINEKYDIHVFSFLMITSQNMIMKCEPCEEMLQLHEINTHKSQERHMRAMTDTKVLFSNVSPLKDEFIREVRPGAFHCGYCATVSNSWQSLIDHLATTQHRESRNTAEWRMRESCGEIAKAKWQEHFERNLMSFILNRFHLGDSSDDEF